jgi:methionyl-tRNA formyltransferase
VTPRWILFADADGAAMALPRSPKDTLTAWVIDPRRLSLEDARRQAPGLPIIAHRRGVPKGTLLSSIAPFQASLGLVVSYSRILRPSILDHFSLGIANLHGGRLPQYRGANVLQWAIIQGETETAMSLHYLDAGIDTGPVIAETPVPILEQDTAREVRQGLARAGESLLDRWLPRLLQEKCPATIQSEKGAHHWPRRTPEDSRIDWKRSDEEIHNLMRAMVPPWPPAFTELPSGERLPFPEPLSLPEIATLRSKYS